MSRTSNYKVLIDGIIHTHDGHYVLGKDISGRTCRASYHSAIEYCGIEENFKVITCGHVYIWDFNEATYEPESPITFEEYLKNKKNET